MASKDDRNRAAAASDDDEEVALDHELLQEERIMRAQPANSFHSEERDLTGDFSVEDLEGELMRGVGGSSEYHLRSVSVASHVAMGPSFGDAAYGVAAMQPKAASASAMGLSAADFASASSSSSSPSSSGTCPFSLSPRLTRSPPSTRCDLHLPLQRHPRRLRPQLSPPPSPWQAELNPSRHPGGVPDADDAVSAFFFAWPPPPPLFPRGRALSPSQHIYF